MVTAVDARGVDDHREVRARDRQSAWWNLSIPLGVLAGDQMVKTAQVDLVTAQTVCAGKYIVVVSGEVAAVRSSVSARD